MANTTFSPGEEAQLAQTIEMFEVITESQPQDYQSLEILKEAYSKLGREKDVVNTSKRIAEAYVQMGQLSSAILEYETILQRNADDPDVARPLKQIESKANNFRAGPVTPSRPPAKPPPDPAKPPKLPGKPAPAPSRGWTAGDAQGFCREQDHHVGRLRFVLGDAGSRRRRPAEWWSRSSRFWRTREFCRWKNR